jgi:DNA-binding winged helix-turn-helix (wHTH) protein/TolB-like protein/Flp pilus assembly protein TadD
VKKNRHFEFGEFQLDVRERALSRNGETVQLTPKAFDTLVILVENAGSLVEKDEMMRAVWPDSFVEEIGVARNISVLRKALGEDAGEHQFIETVPKRGYRFTAQVREQVREHVDDAPGSAGILPGGLQEASGRTEAGKNAGAPRAAELVFEQSSVSQTVEIYREYSTGEDMAVAAARPAQVMTPEPSTSSASMTAQPRPIWKSKRAVAVFALSFIALIAALWFLNANRTRPLDKLNIKSIAVLPFKRLDTADDNERLGIGMADTLITRLSNIRELSIRPTRDVMRYEDAQGDIAEAGRALDVDAILDGSIQRGGDRLRVTVRLIHTESKSQIWAQQFDEKLTDVFTMQDAISAQVVKSLSLNLSDLEQRRIKKKYTEDVEAYQAYLKGRYFLNKQTKEDLGKTIENFEQAIRLSPNYALAYAGLADVYANRANRAATSASREQNYMLAKVAAIKAIEIDSDLAEAHASLGFILRSADWDWIESERALKRAIELNPHYPTAHHYYALLLASLGRMDEAVTEITTAQRLDPLSLLINADLAEMNIFARRPEQAIEVANKALEMDHQFFRLHLMLMSAYLEAGKLDDAIREAKSIPDTEGRNAIFPLSILGCAYAAAGQKGAALQTVEKLLVLSDQYPPALVQAAATCSRLGDKDRAFELMEKALAVKNDRLLFIKVDPRFDDLRSDERYERLLRRMNLPK